nr:ATP synthase F0 subunit 8 [Pessoaiella absita]
MPQMLPSHWVVIFFFISLTFFFMMSYFGELFLYMGSSEVLNSNLSSGSEDMSWVLLSP